VTREALPPPLPPETRTVGQLVAEAVRLYGARFWPSLALGIAPGIAGVVLAALPGWADFVFLLTGGALLLTASYIGAVVIAGQARLDVRTVATALFTGVIVFAPFPFLAGLLLLPGLAWLALFGLAVPAAVLERVGVRDALRRALVLARADYVHALGSLAALAIVTFLTSTVLFFLLRGQGDATLLAAAFLAILVISPVLFLGSALLYFDQAARVVDSRPQRKRRSRDADVHPADEPDGAGRPDAEVEPRAPAGGQPRRRGARG
jgi:hypothetical protein